MAIGGSIESVQIDGREFAVAADSEANRKLGGFENEIQMNGNGTGRDVKTRVPHRIGPMSVEVDDDRGDQEYLQAIMDGKRYVPVAITLASGAVYQGESQLTGEVQFSTQNSTAELTLEGPGKLTKQ